MQYIHVSETYNVTCPLHRSEAGGKKELVNQMNAGGKPHPSNWQKESYWRGESFFGAGPQEEWGIFRSETRAERSGPGLIGLSIHSSSIF